MTQNGGRDKRFTIDLTLMSRHLEEVATSTLNQKLSRHQLPKKLRSRHHSVVVTSVAKKEGRDIIQRSRHPLQRPEGRDIIQWSRHQLQGLEVTTSLAVATSDAKERKSRHHSVVATSVTRKRGRDVI